MTGVEAVSNGMSAFKEPATRYGRRTLTVIVACLGLFLVGITYLTKAYGILAMDQARAGYQSVLSQLARAVVGNGLFYNITIGSLLCVLTLSANTSFVDFPRLCRMVAQDGFLPQPFAVAGRRLVFSMGILYLAIAAGILLVVFRGITDRLIPLFAIGAFLTFTMSQIGMVVHWRRARRSSRGANRLHLLIWGASATGVALVVIVAAKFTEGAWITVLVIPGVVVLLRSIKGYYDQLDTSLRDDEPLSFADVEPPVVLVATQGWNKLTDKALSFAHTPGSRGDGRVSATYSNVGRATQFRGQRAHKRPSSNRSSLGRRTWSRLRARAPPGSRRWRRTVRTVRTLRDPR